MENFVNEGSWISERLERFEWFNHLDDLIVRINFDWLRSLLYRDTFLKNLKIYAKMLQSIFPNLVSVTGDHHQPMITGDHAGHLKFPIHKNVCPVRNFHQKFAASKQSHYIASCNFANFGKIARLTCAASVHLRCSWVVKCVSHFWSVSDKFNFRGEIVWLLFGRLVKKFSRYLSIFSIISQMLGVNFSR